MEKGESGIPVTNLDDEHANKTECEEFQFSSPNGLILDVNSTSNINNGNLYDTRFIIIEILRSKLDLV